MSCPVYIYIYTKILEVNLFAFAYRLFRRDFSPLDGTYCMGTHSFLQLYMYFVLIWEGFMGIRSKRPKTKTSQVICQNVPFLVSQNVPSIFSLYLIKFEVANIFYEHTGQNVPKSNRPKSKRPKVKLSQVKTSQSQNVPESKRPKSKRPRVKMSQS